MSKSFTEVTLKDLHTYAKTYFPETFASLPPLDSIKFQPYDHEKLNEKVTYCDGFEPLRIRIGTQKGEDVQSYMPKDGGSIYYTVGNTRTPRLYSSDVVSIERRNLIEPWGFALFQGARSWQNNWIRDDLELDCILKYYFLLKGAISVMRCKFLLSAFENACKGIAARTSPGDYMVEGPTVSPDHLVIYTLDERAAEQFKSCTKSEAAEPEAAGTQDA